MIFNSILVSNCMQLFPTFYHNLIAYLTVQWVPSRQFVNYFFYHLFSLYLFVGEFSYYLSCYWHSWNHLVSLVTILQLTYGSCSFIVSIMLRLDFSFYPLMLIVLSNLLMTLGKYLSEHCGRGDLFWLTVNGSISHEYGAVCSHLCDSGSRKLNQAVRL